MECHFMPGDAIVNFTENKIEWGKQYLLEKKKNYSKGEISELFI